MTEELSGEPLAEAPSGTGVDVQAALSELSKKERDTLLLREYLGFSYDDIARILKIPIGTVRSRLAKGRERMRKFLL